MNRLKRNFSWMILFGFLAANLLAANPGWTADKDPNAYQPNRLGFIFP